MQTCFRIDLVRKPENRVGARLESGAAPLPPKQGDQILHKLSRVVRYANLFWGAAVPKNTPFPAFRAYALFIKWIDEFLVYGPSEESLPSEEEDEEEGVDQEVEEARTSVERLEALLNSVLERLKLAVISLGEKDDAQVIFETLNSKGEPLLAMDLVRNNIFHRAERQGAGVEDLYRKQWDPLDHAWWREAAPNARPTRPRIGPLPRPHFGR